MDTHQEHSGGHEASPSPSSEAAGEQLSAWKEIENGRYQPRRIRGSCLGRELG